MLLRLIVNENRLLYTLQLPSRSGFVPADDNNIHIGPSIMKWTLDTLNKEPDFQTKFFDIVKSHIDVAMNSIQTYSIGFIENFAWETNKPLKKGCIKQYVQTKIQLKDLTMLITKWPRILQCG